MFVICRGELLRSAEFKVSRLTHSTPDSQTVLHTRHPLWLCSLPHSDCKFPSLERNVKSKFLMNLCIDPLRASAG